MKVESLPTGQAPKRLRAMMCTIRFVAICTGCTAVGDTTGCTAVGDTTECWTVASPECAADAGDYSLPWLFGADQPTATSTDLTPTTVEPGNVESYLEILISVDEFSSRSAALGLAEAQNADVNFDANVVLVAWERSGQPCDDGDHLQGLTRSGTDLLNATYLQDRPCDNRCDASSRWIANWFVVARELEITACATTWTCELISDDVTEPVCDDEPQVTMLHPP